MSSHSLQGLFVMCELPELSGNGRGDELPCLGSMHVQHLL
jgi:hypothetical protein